MLILNFSHPLTETQIQQIETLTQQPITAIHHISTHLDNSQPFPPQIHTLLQQIPLTPQQWQTQPILINPPAYAPVTATLLAHLHGLMGYFPAILRIRPIPDSTPLQFEIAEILNLQAIRDKARQNRTNLDKE